MKRLLTLTVLSIFCFNSFSQDKSYVINFSIPDMKSGQKIELYSYDDESEIATVQPKGSTAQLKFTGQDYVFAYVKFPPKKGSYYVFLEPGVYNVNFKYKDMGEYGFKIRIDGSKSNEELQNYTDSLFYNFDLYKDEKDPDQKKILKEKIVSNITSVVKKNPGSFCSAMVITEINKFFEENPSDLNNIYSLFNNKVKQSAYGEKISKLIEKEKMMSMGKVFPSFQMKDVNNNNFELSQLKGKYVLLDFWASWCRPCREENPNVKEAYETYKGNNFTIVGISLDEDEQDWKDAIKSDDLTWYHVSDLAGWKNKLAKEYLIESIPFNILLDPSGKIIAKDLRGINLFKTLRLNLKK
ncbi:MAG: AhpC/TSA family protein [Ferruginibacter sp.]|nr:AhpC/TSA family protein [Ferruginibacter sp.]